AGGLYWGVSAMPGTGRTAQRRRLFTVNAHNVELLYMLHYREDDEIMSALNVAPGVLTPRDRRELYVKRHSGYRSYGECDTVTVLSGDMDVVLARPNVLSAARAMALGLMRRGPSNFAKFHSDALLDSILLNRSEPPGPFLPRWVAVRR